MNPFFAVLFGYQLAVMTEHALNLIWQPTPKAVSHHVLFFVGFAVLAAISLWMGRIKR